MKYKLLFAEIWAYNVYRRPVRTDKVAMNIIKTQANKSYTCISNSKICICAQSETFIHLVTYMQTLIDIYGRYSYIHIHIYWLSIYIYWYTQGSNETIFIARLLRRLADSCYSAFSLLSSDRFADFWITAKNRNCTRCQSCSTIRCVRHNFSGTKEQNPTTTDT